MKEMKAAAISSRFCVVRLWWTVVRQMKDFFVGKPIFLCYNNYYVFYRRY